MGHRFVGVYDTDQASNSTITEDTRLMDRASVNYQIENVVNGIREKQMTTGSRVDNCEIKTAGLDTEALVGILYYPAEPDSEGLNSHKFHELANALTQSHESFHGQELAVMAFHRDQDSGLPELRHMATIKITAP